MITGITIENFKGIREPVKLDFRPITLLFGPNSAGKSTVLHALHYAREVFERHNLDADQTIAGGKYIDLGGFRQLEHRTCVSSVTPTRPAVAMRFDLDLRGHQLPSYGADLSWFCHNHGYRFESLAKHVENASVQVSFTWSHEEACPYVSELAVFLNGVEFAVISAASNLRDRAVSRLNQDHPVLLHVDEASENSDRRPHGLHDGTVLEDVLANCRDIVFDGNHRIVLAGRGDALPDLDRPLAYRQLEWFESEVAFRDAEDESDYLVEKDRFDTADEVVKFLSELILGPCQLLRTALRNFRYLGPLRETPPRQFLPPRYPDPSRWSSGLGAWDALQSGSDELVNAVGTWLGDASHLDAGCTLERRRFAEIDTANPYFHKLISGRAFDDVDQDERIDFSRVSVNSRVVIIPQGSDVELRPHDVGIGISQVVPVVVTAVDGQNRLLAIEQPELHIHPRLQAALADLFIESVHRNGHTFIIETHSEHLILRMLRRFRESEKGTAPADRQLRTDELAIHYFRQEKGATTSTPIDVDVKGEFIQPWPDDFFEIDFFERFPDAR